MDALHLPGGPGVRVDTHLRAGYAIPPQYDSLVAKLIAHGATRSEALQRMRAALGEFIIGGTATNIPLHRALMDDQDFIAGGINIHYLEDWLDGRRAQT